MKIESENLDIKRSNMSGEKAFGVELTAKAYRLLAGDLYSDSITAVVRELSCNALDAHIDAGTPELPFNIHLPNDIEPYFEVEDFGIGLSEEDIFTVYTTLFKSTKESTNSLTGCLGLGSKTPFSITDNFVISSRFDGVEYHYLALLNEERIPSIMKTGEEPTDKHNGLTVNVPVPKSKWYDMAHAANEVFRFFKVPPKITGGEDYTRKEIVFYKDAATKNIANVYFAEKRVLYYTSAKLTAVMGNIAYPIDLEKIYNDQNNLGHCKKVKETFKQFDTCDIFIDVEIGDLSITPNREQLDYDDKTKLKIESIFDNFLSTLDTEIKKECEYCMDEWDAVRALSRVSKIYGTNFINNIVVKTMMGQNISSSSCLDLRKIQATARIYTEDMDETMRLKKSISVLTLFSIVDSPEDYIFIYNDESSKHVKKLSYLLTHETEFGIVRKRSRARYILLSFSKEQSKKMKDPLTEMRGVFKNNVNIIPISTIQFEQVEQEESYKTAISTSTFQNNVLHYSNSGPVRSMYNWTKTGSTDMDSLYDETISSVRFNKSATDILTDSTMLYYVPLKRFEPIDISTYYIRAIHEFFMYRVSNKKSIIIGVRGNTIKKFEADPRFKSIEELPGDISVNIPEWAIREYARGWCQRSTVLNELNRVLRHVGTNKAIKLALKPTTENDYILFRSVYSKSKSTKYSDLIDILYTNDISTETKDDALAEKIKWYIENFHALMTYFIKKYSMLNIVNAWEMGNDRQYLDEYVRLCNK